MLAQTDAPSPASSPKRLTWRTCRCIVLLAMAAGVILAALRPVWFAPPLLPYTPLHYLGLALMRVPILGGCAILRPFGGCRAPARLFTLGMLVNLVWGILSGPNLGTEMLSPFRVLDCRNEPLPGNRMRYNCTSPAFFASTT